MSASNAPTHDPRFKAKIVIAGDIWGNGVTKVSWVAAPGAVSYGLYRGSRDAYAEYQFHLRRQRKAANKRKAQRRARTGRRK